MEIGMSCFNLSKEIIEGKHMFSVRTLISVVIGEVLNAAFILM